MPVLGRILKIGWRRSNLGEIPVQLRAPVPEELPQIADLADHVHVQVRDHQLVAVLAGLGQDTAPRVDHVRGAVEPADVSGRLDAGTIDGADEYAVGDRRGGLLELPQVLAQSGHRG